MVHLKMAKIVKFMSDIFYNLKKEDMKALWSVVKFLESGILFPLYF